VARVDLKPRKDQAGSVLWRAVPPLMLMCWRGGPCLHWELWYRPILLPVCMPSSSVMLCQGWC